MHIARYGRSAAAAVMVLAGAGLARAADATVYEDGAAVDQAAAESMFDVAFGVTVTSEYVSRGYALSDGIAVQPWVEFDYGMFYVGYWGSNVVGDWEHDLSVGFRPEIGPFSLDLGYVRYLYNSGDCCGELYLKASVSPADPLTVGAAAFFDPDSSNAYFEGNASIDLPHNFSISGAAGVQTYGDGSADDFSWNAGGSWSPLDWLTLDGRYHGGPDSDMFVVSLAISTSLSALSGN
ncbi:MAG: TorF family putative porin [Bauldia sp.]